MRIIERITADFQPRYLINYFNRLLTKRFTFLNMTLGKAMLTPKMQKIADDIGNNILKHYEQDYLDVLFFLGITIEDVIFQVLVLCCRYAYLINLEKHPIAYYIDEEGLEPDLARKEHERIIKYVQEKFKLSNDRLQENISDTFLSPNLSLSRKRNRFPEYSFSKFQYWENKNIHDMKLVKSILEKRLCSSKKVSNDKFIDISNEYDCAVETMKQQFGRDPESTVFSSVQFFTLQTKYSFDYFYELAVKMEEKGIKEIPKMHDRLMTLAGTYKSNSILPDRCPELASDADRIIEYPLILQRRRIIDYTISAEKDNFILDSVLAAFIEANVLVNALRSHIRLDEVPLPRWIAEHTSIEDWASVFEIFNVFQTFVPGKEWTNSRIRSVRKMYDTLSVDYKELKHPENRP